MNRTLKEWLDDYRDYRLSYNLSDTDIKLLRTFVNWCHGTYPDEPYPSQKFFDEYGAKRETETELSRSTRVTLLNRFMQFLNDRGCAFTPIVVESRGVRNEPSVISEEEFRNVLRAADEMPITGPYIDPKRSMVNALEMPVMIRLLYSTGIRPGEGRHLNWCDHNYDDGILHIRSGKGYKERLVALDPNMNELLKVYHEKISQFVPGCVPMFPSETGEYRGRDNICRLWRCLFDKYNSNENPQNSHDYKEKPGKRRRGITIYSLRHYYIIQNIEKLPQNGYVKDMRLIAISRSVGHSTVDVTIKYYYHLTPRIGDLIEEKLGSLLDDILPDVED